MKWEQFNQMISQYFNRKIGNIEMKLAGVRFGFGAECFLGWVSSNAATKPRMPHFQTVPRKHAAVVLLYDAIKMINTKLNVNYFTHSLSLCFSLPLFMCARCVASLFTSQWTMKMVYVNSFWENAMRRGKTKVIVTYTEHHIAHPSLGLIFINYFEWQQ